MTTHINPETGEHGKCTAIKKDCPYQKKGDELGLSTHFKTVKEAKLAGEKIKEELYGQFGTVAGEGNTSKNAEAELNELLQKKSIDQILNSVKTSPEVLKLIAKDKLKRDSGIANRAVLKPLLKNRNTDAETLEIIAQQNLWAWERADIATHSNCPKELLDEMKEHEKLFKKVTSGATTEELDEILAIDRNKEFPYMERFKWNFRYDDLRLNMSNSPNLSDNAMKQFLNSDYVLEESKLARITALAQQIKSKKTFDELYEDVTSDDSAVKNFPEKLVTVTKSEYATPEQLQNLANLCSDKMNEVAPEDKFLIEGSLANVAANKNTSKILLKRLSTSRLVDVKIGVAGNPNAPEDVLKRLSTLSSDRILFNLAENPSITPKIQTDLFQKHVYLWRNLVKNPNLSPETLDVMADSKNKFIVDEVRKHPKTSMKTLLKLGEREAAQMRPGI